MRWVEVALQKKLVNGRCAWWTGRGGFKKGSCTSKSWVRRQPSDEVVSYKIGDPLQRSKGTKVKNYTVFSRGIDKVGNIQRGFDLGQNKNRFEVT